MKTSCIFTVLAATFVVNAFPAQRGTPSASKVALEPRRYIGQPSGVVKTVYDITATPVVRLNPLQPKPTEAEEAAPKDDRKDPDGEYWRKLYNQHLRVVIDAKVPIPLTAKMEWGQLSYRDKAERLYELVAFSTTASPPAAERDLAVETEERDLVVESDAEVTDVKAELME